MATLPTLHIKSKIEILYFPDIARQKPQKGKIISLGSLLPSTTYLN